MANSSSPPPTTSTECLLGDPKLKVAPPPDSSALKIMSLKQKITRKLPNFSDCHGCSCRINNNNPKERLQPLVSEWRIILLCKKCIKQVNNGELCTYCLKDTSKLLSDCFICGDCCHLAHNNCIVNYEKSPPWCYNSSKLVCIDCWLPEKLKRPIKGRKEKPGLGKNGNGGGNTVAVYAKESKRAFEKKVKVALKAKKTALRKAVLARNALECVKNALDLVVTKCDSTRVVDDAEFAIQLHHAMNSSPRILKKTCTMNHSRSENLLRVSDSLDENGKTATSVEANGSCTFTDSGGLKPDVVATFKCSDRKRKELLWSGTEASGSYTTTDSCKVEPEIATYKQYTRRKKECQPSVLDANGSFTCDVKGNEGPQSGLDANGSGNLTEFSGLKPETFTSEQNEGKGKELQLSGVEAIGSNREWKECQEFAMDAVNEDCDSIHRDGLNAEVITYKRDKSKRKRKECEQIGDHGNLGNGDGSIANYTHAEHINLVGESQSSLQDKSKEELCSEGCIVKNAEIIIYKRDKSKSKRKGKEHEQIGEHGNLGNGDGSIANYTHAEHSNLVRESQSSLQDKSN